MDVERSFFAKHHLPMSLLSLPSFRPLPLLGNPHLQTILGTLLPTKRVSLPTKLQIIDLPDGDQLAVHDTMPSDWQPGDPAVGIVHGLGGCYLSPYMVRLTRHLVPHGMRVLRIDLRGAGAGAGLARTVYNGACSGDVRAVVEWFHRQAPTSPLALVGMSLGGSIILKLAGEAAHHPLPGLALVAAVSAPLDLVDCATLLDRKPIYSRYYVHHRVRQIRANERHFPHLPPAVFPKRMTLRTLDEIHTAPLGGFADATDYYRQASSLPHIPNIQVPTLLLMARDDPFILVENYDALPALPHVQVCIANHGGHLGFLGWDGRGIIRWSEQQIVQWLCTRLTKRS